MDIDTANLEIEMNRGFLQILALVALDQPMYGYRMLKLFEQLGYTVEENSLYPILRRLEKNGWVRSAWETKDDRPRKYYHLTAAGRAIRDAALSRWNDQNKILHTLTKENSRVSKS